MKKITIIIAAMAIMMSCDDASRCVQPNGLSYKFLGHIGPDSCRLYRCYYAPNSSVLMTVCDEAKNTTTSWTVKEGKNDVQYSNTTTTLQMEGK